MTREAGPFVQRETYIIAMCRALNGLDDAALNSPPHRALAYAKVPPAYRDIQKLVDHDILAFERQKLYRAKIKRQET